MKPVLKKAIRATTNATACMISIPEMFDIEHGDIVMIDEGRIPGQILITILDKDILRENLKRKDEGEKDLLTTSGRIRYYKNPEDEAVDECERQTRKLLEEEKKEDK